MKFEESLLSTKFDTTKLDLGFGFIFLADNFFIMEVNEGEHFNRVKLDQLLSALRTHYGTNKKIAYIANRVNSYSIDPILWSYFDEDDSILLAGSIVVYRESTMMSAAIEKQLSPISLKRSSSLEEAVNWVENLAELN